MMEYHAQPYKAWTVRGGLSILAPLAKRCFPRYDSDTWWCPPTLVEVMRHAQTLLTRQVATVEQATLAAFITQGELARHIRRTRTLYAARRRALITSLRATFGNRIQINETAAGLHVVVWLRPTVDLRKIADVAAHAGIDLRTTDDYVTDGLVPPGILLGFAAAPAAELRTGVEQLSVVIGPYL